MLEKRLFGLGLAVTIATGLFNLGIIAIDDYNNGFAAMIPAQYHPGWWQLAASGIHPVLPKLLLTLLTQAAFSLGVLDPVWQLRLALAALGAFVFSMNAYCSHRLFQEPRHRVIALSFIGFYFACPLFSTRPMIETFALPFLTLSATFAALYSQEGLRKHLLWALLYLCAASLMRFQSGICGVALVYLIIYRRQWRDLRAFLALGLVLFVLSGLPDIWLRGQFHGLLRYYLSYNFGHAGEHYGRMPFYTFWVLAVALTLPPAFFSLYPGLNWKRSFRRLLAPLLYVFLFLVSHSISPHKEDRFIVPVLVLLLFCLVPLADYLWQYGGAWRKAWFLGINAVLLFAACTNVAQNNLLSLVSWLRAHPEIQGVDGLNASLVIHPQAFLLRPIDWQSVSLDTYGNTDCRRIAVVRSDIKLDPDWSARFQKAATFSPGWVEQVLVRLNAKNARRGPLIAYLPKGCERLPIF